MADAKIPLTPNYARIEEVRRSFIGKLRRPLPTRAYGIYLPDECLLRIGKRLYASFDTEGVDLENITPRFRKGLVMLAMNRITLLCLLGVEGLCCTRQRLLLVRTKDGSFQPLLVLAENSSEEAKEMKNSPEVIEDLLAFLGLEGQQPAWYRVICD